MHREKEVYLCHHINPQVSSQEFSLLVGEDRIVVETRKYGYVFDKFVNFRLQQDRAQALFDKTTKVMQCTKFGGFKSLISVLSSHFSDASCSHSCVQ